MPRPLLALILVALPTTHAAVMPGAIVRPSALQTVQTGAPIIWGTVISDANGMWSNSNPTRLTVTAGAGAGRYQISVSFQSASAGATCMIQLFKNGSPTPLAAHDVSPWSSNARPAETLEAFDQSVVGDYYEIRIVTALINGIQVDPVTRFTLQRVD